MLECSLCFVLNQCIGWSNWTLDLNSHIFRGQSFVIWTMLNSISYMLREGSNWKSLLPV